MTEDTRLKNIEQYYTNAIQQLTWIYKTPESIARSIKYYEERMYRWFEIGSMEEVARCRGNMNGLYAMKAGQS